MFQILAAILILTALFWAANKVLKRNLFCPICAATAATWLLALIGSFAGVRLLDDTWLAVLMAVSLGAIIQKYGGRFGLLWKTAMVIFGAPAVYLLSKQDPRGLYFVLAAIFSTALLSINFTSKSAKGLYKGQFDDCCD